jgi:glycolate oxidase iron-sulfur subunit
MTQSGFTTLDAPNPDAIYQCIRCGMCLPHCPTYAVLGIEQDSPRGRIALIKAVSDGRLAVTDQGFQTHLAQCLGCRACETACPAGVQFGYLLETARGQIEQARSGKGPSDAGRGAVTAPAQEGTGTVSASNGAQASAASQALLDESGNLAPRPSPQERLIRWLVFGVLFPSPRRLNIAGGLLRFYQRSGVQALARRLGLIRLFGLEKQEALLPTLSRSFYNAKGTTTAPTARPPASNLHPQSRRVALFAGCVQRLMFADVNRATERVLTRNGCSVTAPTGQTCCGALHAHAGEREGAKVLARQNLDAFDPASVDAIIINAAGCGAMLKEYGELLHDDPHYAARAAAFSAKVRDIHEYLAGLPLDSPRSDARPQRVTYQDACHLLHGQRIRSAPREILKSIPGLELVEMNQSDWCCGSAGVYNVTQPDLSAKVLALKMDNVANTQAQVLAAGNPGCILQLQSGLRGRGIAMRVAHPIELLDEAYRAER